MTYHTEKKKGLEQTYQSSEQVEVVLWVMHSCLDNEPR